MWWGCYFKFTTRLHYKQFHPPQMPPTLCRLNQLRFRLFSFIPLWQTSVHLQKQLQICHSPNHPRSPSGFSAWSPTPILYILPLGQILCCHGLLSQHWQLHRHPLSPRSATSKSPLPPSNYTYSTLTLRGLKVFSDKRDFGMPQYCCQF